MADTIFRKHRGYSRLLPIIGGSALVTAGLFTVMNALVAADDTLTLDGLEPREWNDYLMTPTEEEVPVEIKRVPKPVEVKEEPPILEPHPPVTDGHDTSYISIPGPEVLDLPTGTVDLGTTADGDMLPIVVVAPTYPSRAAERGVEGYALISLTVTADGIVEDERVVEAEPRGYFERSALQAVQKFKYKPRIINGKAVPVSGVLYKMHFKLAEG